MYMYMYIHTYQNRTPSVKHSLVLLRQMIVEKVDFLSKQQVSSISIVLYLILPSLLVYLPTKKCMPEKVEHYRLDLNNRHIKNRSCGRRLNE